MNTNYETVVSLIELLVKKAGFDLSNNYSEIQLQKTKDSISELMKERTTTKDKKALNALIDNLKIRQANWENNAEMVGKSLVKAYEEGKDYSSVRARIELLSNLAAKGTDNVSVGDVYGRLKSLDGEYNSLVEKIETTDYRNEDEKEMDTRYKAYLENKISSTNSEIEALDKELESLRDIEIKDVQIVAKIKEYVNKLNSDKDRIDKVVSSSINSDIGLDVWQRLEVAKNTTVDKLNHANELLSKTEDMLEGVRKNKNNITERKKLLETENTRCNTKLNNIKSKLDDDDYLNNTLKMIDVNNSEMMKLELESLKNKKDVIYVDVGKVKDELIKAWGKARPPIIEKSSSVSKEDVSDKKTETSNEKEELVDKIEEITNNAVNAEKEELTESVNEIIKSVETKDNELEKIKENIIEINDKPQEPVPQDDVEVEKIVLDDDKTVEDVINDLEELIEKSEKNINDVNKKSVLPNVEKVAEKKEEKIEKKNKIELDW